MPTKSVRFKKQVELGNKSGEPVPVNEGIALVKKMAAVSADRSYKNGRKRKAVDQTVEIAVHLGIDPRQADQMLRGSISLPKGTGQTQRVIAFCDGDMIEQAKEAGAIEAGIDELIEKISKGWTDFDVAIAHPQMMGKVGKLGRVLGPQGKMPSPKTGTVTPDVATGVKEYTAGKLEYRNDAGGNIHLRVGKVSFSDEDLQENIEALLDHLLKIKPATAKGTYVQSVHLSAQQTPSVLVAVG
ncbi:MAG TPA: 50S ribosomal protein L1 [Phycisphaerae bacterium]|nr:50S ribosomal protein L1 [Phycisphaerae bacterium]